MANLSSEPHPSLAAERRGRRVSRVDPASVRRVLVIRPRFVGDLCLMLPVLDHLRRHAPHVEIDLLAEQPYARLLEGDPRLRRVIAVPGKPSTKRSAALYGELARGGYDVTLDLFCNPRTALWTLASGARVRVGYRNKGWRSAIYNRHPVHDEISAVRFHLASIAALGWEVDGDAVPSLALAARETWVERERLRRRRIATPPEARWIGIHPGARWPTRQWDPARYAALAHRAAESDERNWALVFGGPGEVEMAERVASEADHPRVAAVTGLDLRELAALMSLCSACVGADSGPIHVSVATGTPTVGLFGRALPERFFPYPPDRGHRAVYEGVWCSPCPLDVCSHTSCMRSISVDRVWHALSEILTRTSPWPGSPPALVPA